MLSESLLNLVSESQKLDQKVLKFLTKPLENPAARYTIYKLYTHQEDNPVVVAYIKKLDKKEDFDVLMKKEVQIEVEFDKQHVLLCSKVYLQGTCRLFREVTYDYGRWFRRILDHPRRKYRMNNPITHLGEHSRILRPNRHSLWNQN